MRRLLAALLLALPLLLSALSALALPPGDHSISFGERSYLLHVPPQLEPRPALVLNFHGGGGNAGAHQRSVQMDALADKEGFLVVYPEGTGPLEGEVLTWNAGGCCGSAVRDKVDDVGFVRKLLFDLSRRQAYDPARVYATGLSNGAMLAYRLAAELSDRVAAIAPVAGAIAVERFPAARAVPVLHIHSVDDPSALYAGGLGPPFPMTNARVMHLAVDAALAEVSKENGCTGAATSGEKKEWKGHTATLLAYPGCRAEVLHWKLAGAGHVWPSGVLGPGTAVIDANAEMWKFFQRHRLPAP